MKNHLSLQGKLESTGIIVDLRLIRSARRRIFDFLMDRHVGSKKHYIVGLAAASALLSIYIVVVTLTQGFKHALEQSVSLWP